MELFVGGQMRSKKFSTVRQDSFMTILVDFNDPKFVRVGCQRIRNALEIHGMEES